MDTGSARRNKVCPVRGVDYYELLGVEREASSAEIRSAYRSLAKVMHPDAGGSSGGFRALQEAYDTLRDPARRRAYDRGWAHPRSGPRSGSATRPPRSGRAPWNRPFGDDPDFVPPKPDVDPDDLGWWRLVDTGQRVRYAPVASPGHAPALTALCAWFFLLLPVFALDLSPLGLVVWLAMVAAAAAWAFRLVRRYLAATRTDRAFAAEVDTEVVRGEVDDERVCERLTADLLSEYLTRLPGARVFHGLAWPDSVFVDIDHAVLCGRRLVLVESKSWLPGHYQTGDDGSLWRNGHLFRGGWHAAAARARRVPGPAAAPGGAGGAAGVPEPGGRGHRRPDRRGAGAADDARGVPGRGRRVAGRGPRRRRPGGAARDRRPGVRVDRRLNPAAA